MPVSKIMTNVRRLYDAQGNEIGAILSTSPSPNINPKQAQFMEIELTKYASDILYPGQRLNIFKEFFLDTSSIFAIKDINNLPDLKLPETSNPYF
jgi:hypothetical protein